MKPYPSYLDNPFPVPTQTKPLLSRTTLERMLFDGRPSAVVRRLKWKTGRSLFCEARGLGVRDEERGAVRAARRANDAPSGEACGANWREWEGADHEESVMEFSMIHGSRITRSRRRQGPLTPCGSEDEACYAGEI